MGKGDDAGNKELKLSVYFKNYFHLTEKSLSRR